MMSSVGYSRYSLEVASVFGDRLVRQQDVVLVAVNPRFLMAMTSAKGLFHRTFVQSASSLRLGMPETGTEAARKLFANLRLSERQVDEIQTTPAEELVGRCIW